MNHQTLGTLTVILWLIILILIPALAYPLCVALTFLTPVYLIIKADMPPHSAPDNE